MLLKGGGGGGGGGGGEGFHPLFRFAKTSITTHLIYLKTSEASIPVLHTSELAKWSLLRTLPSPLQSKYLYSLAF